MNHSQPASPCPTPGCPSLQPCSSHPYKPLTYVRPWTRSRPYRAGHISGWVWQRIRLRILLRDNHICRYCGRPATVVDHVIALARGGTDDEGNLVAACVACNELKRRQEARMGRESKNLSDPAGGRYSRTIPSLCIASKPVGN